MTLLMMLVAMLGAEEGEPELAWERIRIGETTYEAASVVDVDNDGHLDIVSGGFWHAGPDFSHAFKIWEPKRVDDYYDDFSSYPMDVNGDGNIDIVTGGWWNERALWLENPGSRAGAWNQHEIGQVGNVERNTFHDLDKDGHVELIPNSTRRLVIYKLVRDAQGNGTGKFEEFEIRGDRGAGHGQGFGDINGDGRDDIVLPDGWYEQPGEGLGGQWIWHDDGFNFGLASVPILVHDVNNDGLNDLIVGQGHNYGLDWYGQKVEDGARTWVKHEIEPQRSQFHDVALHDIDNDGDLELVTGKRYRAHMGNDPGANDPLGLYYYEINGGNFLRHTLDYGPADNHSGAGIYFWVEDIDRNGWKDIIAPGKEGLYLFKNKGKLGSTPNELRAEERSSLSDPEWAPIPRQDRCG